MRAWSTISLATICLGLAACVPTDPPTITPAPPAPTPGPEGSGRSVVVTMPAPPQAPLAEIVPLTIDATAPYTDTEGLFALSVPAGWTEDRKTDELSGDARLGTVFVAPQSNGLLSITQFDNGRRPQSLGATVNQVMRMTGVVDEADFLEVRRQNVLDRPGTAMTVEITYTRRNGIPMHGLIRFQIDDTTFSMVNLAVERGSWIANEGVIRDVLGSYSVPVPGPRARPGAPAAPVGPAEAATAPAAGGG